MTTEQSPYQDMLFDNGKIVEKTKTLTDPTLDARMGSRALSAAEIEALEEEAERRSDQGVANIADARVIVGLEAATEPEHHRVSRPVKHVVYRGGGRGYPDGDNDPDWSAPGRLLTTEESLIQREGAQEMRDKLDAINQAKMNQMSEPDRRQAEAVQRARAYKREKARQKGWR